MGRLDPQKGQDLLLAALGGLTVPVHVALVGSAGDSVAARRTADYAGSLHRQVRDLGLEHRVTFLGWRDDVPRLLAAADGYVHTARWEGPALPLAVMEAMAAGCPTVFTDCSGRPPVFEEHRDGLLARTEDPASIRQRIAELCGAASDRARGHGRCGGRADQGALPGRGPRPHLQPGSSGACSTADGGAAPGRGAAG